MRKHAFYWLLLIASLALWQWLDGDEPEAPTARGLGRPDFTASRLYNVSYSEEGMPEYRIYANSMDFYTDSNITRFEQPLILVYPDQLQPVWQITADQAKVLRQQNVAFHDNVVIRNLSRNEYVKDLLTKFVSIDLNQQTMHSDQQVTVLGPSYQLIGTGMDGDLAEETVHLLNDINAVYETLP